MHRAALKLLVSIAIFGAAFPILKWGIAAGATPAWLATWRAALSLATATLVLAVVGQLARPARADWPAIVAIGVFQLAGCFAMLHAGLAFVPAGRGAVLMYTTPLWLVPLSALWLREPIGRRQMLAVALGAGGLLVIANPWSLDWSTPGILAGHGLMLGSALSWAIAIVMLRRSRPSHSTLQLLPFSFAIATLLLVPLALWREPGGGVGTALPSWLALLFVGLLGPIATWGAGEVSRVLPAVVTGQAFLGVPVLGLGISVALLGEALTPSLLVGAVLVLAGVAVAARS